MSELRLSQKPITVTVPLVKADPSGNTTVTVRQHTTNDKIRLADQFAEQTQVFDTSEDAVQIKKRWNGPQAMRQRVFLTLVGCNIINDDTDKPWFNFKSTPRGDVLASEVEFNIAWGALPPEVSDEIYEAILQANPSWNPEKAGE